MENKRIIVASVGLPVQKKGKEWEFLLTKRFAPHKPSFHNKWQLAGGGLEFGETPEQCLIREIKEELSVVPKILYPFPIPLVNTFIGGDDNTHRDVHILLLGYIVDIGKQKIKIVDPDRETSGYGWFFEKEIEKMEMLPKTLDFVKEAVKILNNIN